jgi:hypothetical protein
LQILCRFLVLGCHVFLPATALVCSVCEHSAPSAPPLIVGTLPLSLTTLHACRSTHP